MGLNRPRQRFQNGLRLVVLTLEQKLGLGWLLSPEVQFSLVRVTGGFHKLVGDRCFYLNLCCFDELFFQRTLY